MKTFPSSPTMHSEVDGHDTAPMLVEPSMSLVVQAPDPPVGLVLVRTLPSLSSATHWVVEAHRMLSIAVEPSMSVLVQAEAEPVGLVAVRTCQ